MVDFYPFRLDQWWGWSLAMRHLLDITLLGWWSHDGWWVWYRFMENDFRSTNNFSKSIMDACLINRNLICLQLLDHHLAAPLLTSSDRHRMIFFFGIFSWPDSYGNTWDRVFSYKISLFYVMQMFDYFNGKFLLNFR